MTLKKVPILILLVCMILSTHLTASAKEKDIYTVISEPVQEEILEHVASELPGIFGVVESICKSNSIDFNNVYIGTPFKTFGDLEQWGFIVFVDGTMITSIVVEHGFDDTYTYSISGNMIAAFEQSDSVLFFWDNSALHSYAANGLTLIKGHPMNRPTADMLHFAETTLTNPADYLCIDVSEPTFVYEDIKSESILSRFINHSNK